MAETSKDVTINGHRYRIGKLTMKASEGSFILHQVASNRWMNDPESFVVIQRKALSVCCIYNQVGLIEPVQFDDGKGKYEIVAKPLQDDPGALYALTLQSVEFNIFPTLVGVQVKDGSSSDQSNQTLSPSNTQP